MASPQYNSVYDMYKGNQAKPDTFGNAPDPNADPKVSIYGNNTFGSPNLPNNKPAFNSVYDIYGQGKMNGFSAGAPKKNNSTASANKPNQNPTIGNPARTPDTSEPYYPSEPVYDPGDVSGIDDSEYTPGSGSGFGSSIDMTKPTPPGEPPPLDKAPEQGAPPAPPGGGGGGGGGASDSFGFADASKGASAAAGGGGGDAGKNYNADPWLAGSDAYNDRISKENWKRYMDELTALLNVGLIPVKTPQQSKPSSSSGNPQPLYTDWNGSNWVTTWSDGYQTQLGGPGRQFGKETSPNPSHPANSPN